MLLRLLRTYLAPYRRFLVAVVVFQLLGTIGGLLLPSLNADIIDRGVAVGNTAEVWRLSVWMLGASLVQVACSIGGVWAGARAAIGMGRDVRGDVVRRVMSFSAREVANFGAPSLITRTSNDVQQVQQVVLMGSLFLVGAPIMMVGGVVMALREDVGLSWLVAVAVPLLIACVSVIISRMVPLFRVNQTRIDTVNRVLREQITGIRVVRAFVREDHERARFARANQDLTDVGLAVGRLMVTMFPLVMFIINTSTVAVVWFGAHRVDAGQMQVGSLFAYIAYLVQILMAVMMATMMLTMIPRASVSAERIGEVLETHTSVVVPEQPLPPDPAARGLLEVDDVEFTYPGAQQPVLSGVSFTARPGTVTAVVGGTGSGKTTLISLLPRLVDPTGGQIRLDGVDLRRLDPQQVWSRVGLVPQRPYLFSGTIATNLRYGGPDASDDDLWRALRIAQADDFVQRLELGLDAPVAQGGTNFSGGQRQRLAIARALVARPELYLFDDSFSALDLSTDARLRAALRPETRDATVVIVAQRISTIADADQIVVLDGGHVVGLGTHDELLAGCETYQQIVASQAGAGQAA